MGHWRDGLSATAMAMLLLSGAPASAQEQGGESGVHGAVMGGVALTPDYEGSSDYQITPLFGGAVQAYGVAFELRGPKAKLNFRPQSRFQFGPIVNYRFGRDDVENDQVDRLAEVDGAVEIGGFARYQFEDVLRPADELAFGVSLLADVSGAHEGGVLGLETSYAMVVGQSWRVSADVSANFVDDNYAEAFFGVDAAGSAASGLAAYSPGAGLKDVGAGVTVGYNFTENYNVFGRVGYSRLVGDAADSPVVDEAGSPDQFFVGAGLGYRF